MSDSPDDIRYSVTITGNCGKPHTYEEWQACELCEKPKYEWTTYGYDARTGYLGPFRDGKPLDV